MFILNERLAQDSDFLYESDLSQVRLMKDANPWLLLIPKLSNKVEIIDLTLDQQMELMREISRFSHILKKEFDPDKLNVANLGNVVPQLHIHIVCRYQNDRAWPKPIWGTVAEFDSDLSKEFKTRILKHLK
jgi:diadenosine tetraphosphate (Ap4A) HIT family hydrolase